MPVSLRMLLSDLVRDGISVSFDAPGGVSDRLARVIEQSPLPIHEKKACLVIIGSAFVAHGIFRQNIPTSPTTSFLEGVSGSMLRQQARRLLDNQRCNGPVRGGKALLKTDPEARGKLLEHHRGLPEAERELYQQVIEQCTIDEMESIAEMDLEDLQALLTVLNRPSRATRAKNALCGAMKELGQQCDRWSGRDQARERR